ncbi:MAG: protein translocase subunit SecD, partial [Bauldia sp.]
MLHFPRWQIVLILLLVVLGGVAAAPNLFSKETVDSWPNWLPKQQLLLGLDLQGGAYLLYQVDADDYVEKRLRTLTSEVRRAMLENPRIGYTGLGVQGQGVQLRVRDLDRLDDVRTRLELLRNPLDTSLLTTGSVYEFDLAVSDDGLVRFSYSPAGLAQRIRGIVQQSIEVIDRRINELGTTEPSIQRQGDDRILVEAPGLGDPQRLKALVGQTAQLRFHLVESAITLEQAGAEAPTPGTIRVPDVNNPTQIYVVEESPLMTGEDLTDAQTAFDQITNEPVVNFRLNTSGARAFAEVTQANVGRPFAIVLDD